MKSTKCPLRCVGTILRCMYRRHTTPKITLIGRGRGSGIFIRFMVIVRTEILEGWIHNISIYKMLNLLFWLCLLYPWKTLLFSLCTFDILHWVLIAEVYKMFLYQLIQCKLLFHCLLHLNPWFLIVVISTIIQQNYSQYTLQQTIILQTYPD